MRIGKPNNSVRVKLLVREKSPVKLTSKKKEGVQNIGCNC